MNKHIYKLINEQFNIANMDFGNTKLKRNNNVFNKQIVNPKEFYDFIVDDAAYSIDVKLEEWQLEQMNELVAVVKPDTTFYDIEYEDDEKRLNDFILIIDYYSKYYPYESLNWLDVSDLYDLSNLFAGTNKFNWYAKGLYDISYNNFNGDISKWDVSNVQYMENMFSCSKFNGDISKWDTSHVRNMIKAFEFSEFNGDISKWDISCVRNMNHMFYNSKFNQDISKWDVSNVNDMNHMFYDSKFNQDISKWNVSNVNDMRFMFFKSKFNQDISGWDVSNVSKMTSMFAFSEFNHDISSWNVSRSTDVSYMFNNSKFTGDISNWKVKDRTIFGVQ